MSRNRALDEASRCARVRASLLGGCECLPCPVGARKLTYADATASGRCSALVEQPLARLVLPLHANTHTRTSQAGVQSQAFLDEARSVISEAVGASARDEAVLFVGRGATAASSLLAHVLLQPTPPLRRRQRRSCTFSGCSRAFSNGADLVLHARTHADGEASAHAAALAPAAHTLHGGAVGSNSGDEGSYSGEIRVVVGPFAHHSSFLPWAAAGATLAHVAAHAPWPIDAAMLLEALADAADVRPRLLVCAFTTASNVTGELCSPAHQRALTALGHAFDAVVVWDAAASAPHILPAMSPAGGAAALSLEEALTSLGATAQGVPAALLDRVRRFVARSARSSTFSVRADALYFSTHKLVGGGGGGLPGVLVVRRSLLGSTTPALPGGGTVFFVRTDGEARYLGRDEEREEGGSPDVSGCGRAGLALLLARGVGWAAIRCREAALSAFVRAAWAAEPALIAVGGGTQRDLLPIVSMVVRHPYGGYALHWGFVTAVLNDLFGLQCRGGCLCAGVLVQQLLGIAPAESARLEAALLASTRNELLRPGVVRISLSYNMSHAEAQFIADAVLWTARSAHTLLPLYSPVAETGEWRINRSAAAAALVVGRRLAPTAFASPRDVIAALTGPGADTGCFAEAQRGSTRAHPRRWLTSVSFFDDVEPEAPVILACREADWPALFAAYLDEADALVRGLPSAAAPSSGGDVSILEPGDAQRLRWFALASDGPGCAPCPWPLAERSAVLAAAAGAAAVKEESPLVDAGFEQLARILHTPAAFLSAADRALWDGADCGADIAAEAQPLLPVHDVKPRRKLPSPREALLGRSAQAAVVAGPRRLPMLSATAAQLRRSPAFAFTQAALQSVVGLLAVPPPVARAVAHGLREAIEAFDMIRDGDRVLVGLSGGKDSLTLLVSLLRLQAVAPVSFEVGACTVDPQSSGYDPFPLREWCASLGVRYFVEGDTPIMRIALDKMGKDSICAFCARIKRGLLYAVCRREGFNVLALGQHLDDLAESFLMSATRNGLLRTMKAHYVTDAGDLRVIRPLVFLRERATRDFAHGCRLPVISENCPACFRPADERYRVKRLLATEEAHNPTLFSCLLKAMRPLMVSEMTPRGTEEEDV